MIDIVQTKQNFNNQNKKNVMKIMKLYLLSYIINKAIDAKFSLWSKKKAMIKWNNIDDLNSSHRKTETKQYRRRTCEKQIHCWRFAQNEFNVKCDNKTNWRNATIRHDQQLTFQNNENNQKHRKDYVCFM